MITAINSKDNNTSTIRIFYTLIATVLLLNIFESCSHSQRSLSLNLQDSIVLTVNKQISEPCLAMFYYEKANKNYLYVDDPQNRAIRIIDLDSKSEIQSIPIYDTGINSIPFHFGFIIKDCDSIYLPGGDHKLYCINGNGDIFKKVDFSLLQKMYPLFTTPLSLSRFTKGAIIKGNEIFFLQHDSRKNYFSHKPSDYHFLLKYNIKNDSFGISPISLPNDFWSDGKREMSLFLTYNNTRREFVFGSQFSDNVFISKDGMTISKTYHSRSKSVWEYYPYVPQDNLGYNQYFYSLIKYSFNTGLIWDPYKKVYYKFVWPGEKNLNINRGSFADEVLNNYPTFTIDILDSDFNNIGTYLLPKNKYNWNNYFITKDGLFLALNHPLKDKTNYKWVFHIFKISDLK